MLPAFSSVAAAPAPIEPTIASGYAWGNGGSGKLGNGNNADLRSPLPIALPAGTDALAAGDLHSLALADGQVFAWGSTELGRTGTGSLAAVLDPAPVQLPAGTTVTQIAADTAHNLALTDDGRVFAWGAGGRGQLGDGGNSDRTTPVPVTFPAGVSITSIGTGEHHSLAVADSGTVYTWGAGDAGALDGSTGPDVLVPTQVVLPPGSQGAAVAGGTDHSVLLTRDGRVLTWGTRSDGLTAAAPADLGLTDVTAVAAGDHHGVAVLASGAAVAWGAGELGQLGTGATTSSATPVPVALPGGVGLSSVSVSGNHVLALTADKGHVLAWGDASDGQLNGRVGPPDPTPTIVPLTDGETLLAVAAGRTGNLVLAEQGPLARLDLTPGTTTGRVGRIADYQARGYDAVGHDLGTINAGLTLTMSGGTCSGMSCTAQQIGDQKVTAHGAGVTATGNFFVLGTPATTTPPVTPTSTRPTLSNTGTTALGPDTLALAVALLAAGTAALWSGRRAGGHR